MATYYFDSTPTSNGFGSCTGNWTGGNTWTLNTFGQSGTNVAWPGTTTDSVKLGETGNSILSDSTTGIVVNSNVTVAGLAAFNISGAPTINGNSSADVGAVFSGTSTLTLADGAAVTASNVGSLYLSCPISASGTYSFSTATGYFVNLTGTGTTGITGTLNVTAGNVRLVNNINAQTFLASTTQVNISSGAVFGVSSWVTGLTRATIQGTFSGAGNLRLNGTRSTLTATVERALTCQFSGSISGISGTFSVPTATVNVPAAVDCITIDLPVSGSLALGNPNGAQITVNASGNPSYLAAGVTNTTANGRLFSSGTTGFTITGGVSTTTNFTIGGTASDNIIAGNYAGPSGTPGITKTNAGSWRANGSGAALSSGIAVQGGTYTAANASVTNGTAAVTVSAGATFGVAGNIATFNAPVNLAGTLNNVSGSNTYPATLTLAANAVIRAESGVLIKTGSNTLSTFALTLGHVSDTGVVILGGTTTGSGQMTKVGPGGFAFAGTSSHTGNVAVSAGYYSIRTGVTSASFPSGTFTLSSGSFMQFDEASLAPMVFGAKNISFAAGSTGGLTTGTVPNSLVCTFDSTITLNATSAFVLQGSNTNNNTISTVFAGSTAGGITKSGTGKWVLSAANNLTSTTNINAGTLMAANSVFTNKLVGGTVNVNQGARLQTGIAGTQKGRCTYTNLNFNGVSGTPARLRIGGSAAVPTIYMSGNLTLPTGANKMVWDVSGYAEILKTPGTYTLVAWTTAAGQIDAGDVTANVTLTGLPPGMAAPKSYLTYDSVSSPRRITITTSYV